MDRPIGRKDIGAPIDSTIQLYLVWQLRRLRDCFLFDFCPSFSSPSDPIMLLPYADKRIVNNKNN